MSLKRFLVPCKSFIKNLIKRYFTTNEIIKGFVISVFISNFIFLGFLSENFGGIFDNLFLEFISPFIAIYGFYKLFNCNKIVFFFTGFFIGILWFYWVSFSLKFYGLSFLIPLEILFIAFVYGILFLICGWFNNKFYKMVMLLLISYFYPFNFNWLNLELVLMPGIFEPNIRALGSVFLGIICLYELKNKFKKTFIFIVCLCLSLQITQNYSYDFGFKTKLVNTTISQDIKWLNEYKNPQINAVLKEIDEAIDNNFEFIIFPENAIATYLNLEKNLEKELKEKSFQISILTGALAFENNQIYNSAFLFQNGKISRFDKYILVPFGEEIPLPNFLKNIFNKVFFNGAEDFTKAKNVSFYEINGAKITNAICYEATRPEIYQNSPNFVVAISNNGWFVPSTEPFLQKTLIKYFATKHNTTVYHSVNGSRSEIIKPKTMWIKRVLKSLNL